MKPFVRVIDFVLKIVAALLLALASLAQPAFAQCSVTPTTLQMTAGAAVSTYSHSLGYFGTYGSMAPDNLVRHPTTNIPIYYIEFQRYFGDNSRIFYFGLQPEDNRAAWLNTLELSITIETEQGTQTLDTENATFSYQGPGWFFQDWNFYLPQSPDDWFSAGQTYEVTIEPRGIPCDGDDGYYISSEVDPEEECEPSCDGVGDPINPATGAVYQTIVDLPEHGPIPFRRFYNSTDATGGRLGSAWRHSFSRSVNPSNRIATYKSYQTSPRNSSRYADLASACTDGVAEIRNQVSAWQTATASYADGRCTLMVSGTKVATLPVLASAASLVQPAATTTSVDVFRDDGQLVRFAVDGSSLIAPAGSPLKLEQITGGYRLTDVDDSVEEYDQQGRLLLIRRRGGVEFTLDYHSSGRLAAVEDSFGHSIGLDYDSQDRLSVVQSTLESVTYTYDSANRLSSVTYGDGAARTYLYQNAAFPNALTGLIDENEALLSSWEYDAQGRAITTEEADGANAQELDYNANGSVTVTDALGAVRTFIFGRHGDRVRVEGILGSQCPTCREGKSTSYDLRGYVSSRTDYNDNITTYNHDGRGLELSRTEAAGTAAARTTTTQWHSNYGLPTLVSIYAGDAPVGLPTQTTAYSYDAAGNMLSKTITDPLINVSRTWSYSYNSFGQVLTENAPRTDVNDVTTYTYYACATGFQCGRLHTATNALGHATIYNTYNATGQPLTITDANGVVTTLAYDARLRLISNTTAGETTSLEYWPTSLIKKVTLADGSYVQYTYDDAHRLIRLTSATGDRIEYTLDAMGNRISEQTYDAGNSLARTRTRVFDNLSRLWKQISAAGTPNVTTVNGYDGNGNHTSASMPLGRNAANSYDALNRLVQITDTNSGTTHLEYGARNELTSVTDPRNLTTSYTYNGLDDLTQLNSPDAGSTTYTYDSAGNLATRTDARSKTGVYSYDALNRVTQIAYPTQTLVYTYDSGANGKRRLTGASGTGHATTWMYDAQGRVTGKSQVVSGITKSVGYGYTNGNLTSLTTPSGRTITYGYTNGRVTSLTLNGSTTILSQVIYDPFGPISGWTWGNGTLAVRVHDLDGNITSIDSAGAYSYSYDDALRIIGIADMDVSSRSWTYGYDLLDRLTAGTTTGQTIGYTYDANGNRLTQTGTQTATYTIASGSNRLSSIAGTPARSYVYDASGNVTGDATVTFTYDDAGRMKSSTKAGIMTTYTVNALGQRVRKATGSTVTYFVYDEQGHLLGEYNSSGGLIQETIWLEDIPVATLRPITGGVDLFYVHTDHLNAPRRVSRPSDNRLRWRRDAEPFGHGVPNQNPEGLGIFVYNLRLPGQYSDPETGRFYNYFRDYDPSTGRYMQSDPIGLNAGINTYLYANANSLRDIDPYGLWSITGSFYRGYGGAIQIGYANGKAFVLADAGLGLGGGFSFNPTGDFPRGDQVPSDGPEGFIGFQGTAGLTFGPLGLGGTGYTGGHVSKDCDGRTQYAFADGSNPFGRLKEGGTWGLGLQLSGGVRTGLAF